MGAAETTDPVDVIISGGADDMRAEGDAVAAEAWGSHLLAMFDETRLHAAAAGLDVPPFEEAVLERCRQRADADGLLVAAALAPVLAPPLDEHARRIAGDLRGEAQAPGWLDDIGRTAPSRAFVASDVFGAQDSLMIEFGAREDADDSRHALLVLVDHNLSGRVKDAWLADDLDETVDAWRSIQERHIRIEEIPADEAMRRLHDAMALTEATPAPSDERTEDFAEHQALIWGRLRRAGFGAERRDEIRAAVDAVEDVGFVPDPPDFPLTGPASALLDALEADGVAIDDPAEVMAALESLSDGPLPGAAPRSGPPSAEVVDEASEAPILSRFDALADFYGDGRKLTQTGQPTLADAHTLVEMLGTADRFDEAIGDRTFKTRSAAELPELSFTIRWAVAAGALRKQHGKYLATKKWRTLDGKPLERWEAAADALAELGPLKAFHAGSRYRGSDEVLDGLAPELLYNLGILGDLPFELALDAVCDRADDLYEWHGYLQDAERRRRSLGWDLARLVAILELAGIVERTGVREDDPEERDPHLLDAGGGVLRLTAVGRWWLAS